LAQLHGDSVIRCFGAEFSGLCGGTGSAECSSSTCRGRTDSMKRTVWRWLFWCGSVGLLVPMALILRWKVLGSKFRQIELILWPSSILLIGLEGQRSAFIIILWYAIVIVTNIVFYCVIGLLTWPLLRLALRRRA
jgi:hypothetical protein